ncbi:MAG: hypothetical protein F6K53_14135 [Moorea sp. SIO4A1]|uniref:hypothetical protein n=1 Tax=Moorena sp. SIO4A1 TaxID=2607835 RepID=UPI00144F2968|nr:hypothetical protein [Moorena sp. SIO4A1]NEQ58475.1 hypothetical protein [Moorena sp. SIO4A1]
MTCRESGVGSRESGVGVRRKFTVPRQYDKRYKNVSHLPISPSPQTSHTPCSLFPVPLAH